VIVEYMHIYSTRRGASLSVNVAIVNGFGFGGQNAVSVLSRYAG